MKFKRIIICVFLFLAYQNCKSQIKINSAEETADKLAKQMEVSNSEVLNVWTDLNNLYNIRNDEALKYSKIIESKSKAKISYAKQLTSLIKKIKINNEIITSEKKFISYRKNIEDINEILRKIFFEVENDKLNIKPYQDNEIKLENLENHITIKRNEYNQIVQEYNLKLNMQHANSKFYEKYPNLGKKFYFKSNPGKETSPKVEF